VSGIWIFIVGCVQIHLGDIVGVLGLTCQMVFVKGLVHPKMKIKSLITHPHAVPTP